MQKQFVFVYGSLRRGGENSLERTFSGARFIAAAEARGTLYDFGAYSGMVAAPLDSVVQGEVYEVSEDLLNQLDEFEASSNFIRTQLELTILGEGFNCWVYEPDPLVHRFDTPIASGDWLDHLRSLK